MYFHEPRKKHMLQSPEMPGYNWSLAIIRNLFALLLTFCFAFLNYAGSEDSAPSCNPTLSIALTYLAVSSIILVTTTCLHWAILSGWYHFRHSELRASIAIDQDTNEAVSQRPFRWKFFLLNAISGCLFLIFAARMGGPSPCSPLPAQHELGRFLAECLAFGVGILLVANSIVGQME